MNVILTAKQAADLGFENNREFIRAAFFTGHSLFHIKELVGSPIHEKERRTIIILAYNLGMTESDIVRVR